MHDCLRDPLYYVYLVACFIAGTVLGLTWSLLLAFVLATGAYWLSVAARRMPKADLPEG